ncbi:MAG: hypothetical protein K1W33_05890 [Clostridia bacterium]
MESINKDAFDVNNINPVELRLLNGQVDLILRAIELYSYNLEYMLNSSDATNDERQEKIAMLKFTYEQILATQAEQVNGKSNNAENDLSSLGKKVLKDDNIFNIIPEKNNINVG